MAGFLGEALRVRHGLGEIQFWQRRFYDFNVWSEEKRVEIRQTGEPPKGPHRGVPNGKRLKTICKIQKGLRE
jgi:hypothetical protein